MNDSSRDHIAEETYRVNNEDSSAPTGGDWFDNPWATVFIMGHCKVLVLARKEIRFWDNVKVL